MAGQFQEGETSAPAVLHLADADEDGQLLRFRRSDVLKLRFGFCIRRMASRILTGSPIPRWVTPQNMDLRAAGIDEAVLQRGVPEAGRR